MGSTSTGGSGGKLKFIIIGIIAILAIVLIVVGLRSCAGCSSVNADKTSTDMAETEVEVEATPWIAEGSGVQLHCAVSVDDLTEILIHNASYSYACELTTQLVEATNTDVIAAHGTGRDKASQPYGDTWMTGEFIRCYRSGNAGPTMSAIDCGGPVGATVLAPVTGTVVKVADYDLYNNPDYPDVQIHIQPDGREDLDVVLIHLTDPSVEVGDRVEGGVTAIAKIRDVYAYIGDEMQLKQYTADGDNGNHTHIQINDATNPEYHGLD